MTPVICSPGQNLVDKDLACKDVQIAAPTIDFDLPLSFLTKSTVHHPVVFDTGASLAISPFGSDFAEPLQVPPGELKFCSKANR